MLVVFVLALFSSLLIVPVIVLLTSGAFTFLFCHLSVEIWIGDVCFCCNLCYQISVCGAHLPNMVLSINIIVQNRLLLLIFPLIQNSLMKHAGKRSLAEGNLQLDNNQGYIL